MPQFECPACQKVFRVKDELIGKRVKCHCGNQFVVPGGPVETVAPRVVPTETSKRVSQSIPIPAAQQNVGIGNSDLWGDVPAAPINPYAPIASSSPLGQFGDGNESIRKSHLSHEASIKSIGILYMLGAILGFLFAIVYAVLGVRGILSPGRNPNESMLGGAILLVLAVVAGGMSTFQYILARGLSRLTPWCRIAGIVFSCIGLIGFPIGTLISAYFLYLLGSQKGAYIFSPEYARVIAATPHIKYKTSIIVWILLGILLFFIALGIIAFVASAFVAR